MKQLPKPILCILWMAMCRRSLENRHPLIPASSKLAHLRAWIFSGHWQATHSTTHRAWANRRTIQNREQAKKKKREERHTLTWMNWMVIADFPTPPPPTTTTLYVWVWPMPDGWLYRDIFCRLPHQEHQFIRSKSHKMYANLLHCANWGRRITIAIFARQ